MEKHTDLTGNLYPYQFENRSFHFNSVYDKKGLTFTVEIARQGGKE